MIEVMTFVTASVLAIVAGAVRCVAGWLENALRDDVIEEFEWRKLAGTMAMYLGAVNVASIGLAPEMAVVVAMLLDMARTALGHIAEGKAGNIIEAPHPSRPEPPTLGPKPKYPGGLKIAYEADAEKAKKKK
jgi:hypothetical protein